MKIYRSFTPEVIERLKNGQVGVIPTDTIYGVVGRLELQEAVEKIYDLKNRPQDKRVGTSLVANPNQLEKLVSSKNLEKAQKYWPGVSVEMGVGSNLSYAHKGHGTLAFRVPSQKDLISLLEQTGPLATSSANKAGEPPAVTVERAVMIFGEDVDFYVDGGDLSSKKASKIVRIEPDGKVTIIRE